jgi:hypothetical protein
MLVFAQAVYLMFSSVYVCKQSVEYLLLSVGGRERRWRSGSRVHLDLDFMIALVKSHL